MVNRGHESNSRAGCNRSKTLLCFTFSKAWSINIVYNNVYCTVRLAATLNKRMNAYNFPSISASLTL